LAFVNFRGIPRLAIPHAAITQNLILMNDREFTDWGFPTQEFPDRWPF
jgi:hypothetical protein